MPLELIRPRRWSPPPAPPRAAEPVSATPVGPLRLIPLPGEGPEDVVVDAGGRLLTGLADGRVLRVEPVTGEWHLVADTGGRPLGLEPDGDEVLCCDSRRGLLRLGKAGEVEVLVDEVDGERLTFASNVVRAADGTIWFSASTRHFDLDHYLGDMLAHSGSGRLFRRDPDGRVETVLDGLDFANGVVLLPDGSAVLVAETGGYRITRHHLTGPRAGTSEPFVENLPGFPDNMALGSDGLVWVSLPTARNPLLDRLLPLPGFLRQAAWLLPDAVQPKPAPTMWAMAFAPDGTLVHDRQAPGTHHAFVTSAVEHDGTVYLGSLQGTAIASFRV